MQNTKSYIKNFWKIATWIFGAIALIFTAYAFTDFGESTVGYYCATGNPLFGLNVERYAPCPFYVAIGYILFFTLSTLFMSGVGVIVIDGLRFLGIRVWHGIRYHLIERKIARIIVVSASVENEHFIAVKNDEYWLRADGVVTSSKFIFDNRRFDGVFKWHKENSKDGTTSISRKNYKLLHVATTVNDKHIVHLLDEDVIFPLPNNENPYYVLPLVISGSMSFLGYKVKRVSLTVYKTIYLTNNGKLEIRR